jgi:nucleotide-binding universal stress UspA family protein
MKNILAAVDFSDVTDAVIEAAFEQAVHSNAVVRVVHAAPPIPVYVGYGAAPVQDIIFRTDDLESEQAKLDAIVDRFRDRGVDAVADLPEGPVVDSLMKEIEEHNIDMVIVGSHGHGAVFNIIAGSVTQALLHKAKVPVLVVPTKRAPR